MTEIDLPNQDITGPNLWSQVETNDQAIVDVVNGNLTDDNISDTAEISGSKLADDSVTAEKLNASVIDSAASPTGVILPFAGSSAPAGYFLCDGTAISRTEYSDLFDVCGTAYGAGNGSTTFNLPDLRGRAPVGLGTHASVDTLGKNDGTVLNSRRPAHSHSGTTASNGAHTHSYTAPSGSTNFQSTISLNPGVTGTTSGTTGSNGSHNHTVTVGSTGGTTDAPSFSVVNYIIKA